MMIEIVKLIYRMLLTMQVLRTLNKDLLPISVLEEHFFSLRSVSNPGDWNFALLLNHVNVVLRGFGKFSE